MIWFFKTILLFMLYCLIGAMLRKEKYDGLLKLKINNSNTITIIF